MSANYERYKAGWPSAVIAGAHRTGVVGMRNLWRRGVPVACVDCDSSEPGFLRRYGDAQRCPNPDKNGAGWLNFMLRLAEHFDVKPALIPASDQFLTAIATHADSLSSAYRIGANPLLQGQLSQKESLYSLAGQYGMPIPRTGQVRSEHDLLQFARSATFPCLLKPMSAREWEVFPLGHPLHLEKVAVAHNSDELLAMYQMVAPVSPALSVQEVIEGPDTAKVVYLSCYGHTGQRLGHAMVRELRCQPKNFGSASVCQPCTDEEVEALCNAFLQRVGCRGLCEIELKRDSRDNSVKMIEANPRLSGTGDASLYMGVDLCWLHYLDLIGQNIEPVDPIVHDIRHIVVRCDVLALRKAWEKGELRWKDISKTYRLPLCFYDLNSHDWRYTLKTLYFVLHVALGAIFRKFVPKRHRR
jgi:D-aspartate ligase